MAERITQDWLQGRALQNLLALLNEGKGEARIAGGAVRNALLDEPVNDIDIATTLVPRDVILRVKQAGHKPVPTGIEHGTITCVVDGTPFEVTTLRQDVETNGRHAKVLYGTDWETDARRRDLTINALYLNADGTVFDPLGGMQDVLSQNVRFIDDAQQRIEEDYLRILRFFRFFAWYGKFRPDADGLRACAKLKDGLEHLSAERVWQELSKLLAAPDPGRAVLWMRQTGVLSRVLPETEKWGIDGLPALIDVEQKHGWKSDAALRLMIIVPKDVDRMKALAKRLKMPNVMKDRLVEWAKTVLPNAELSQQDFEKFAYYQNRKSLEDTLKLATRESVDGSKKYLRQLKWLKRFEKPDFPISGQDLLNQNMRPGPQVAEKLRELETRWVESGFELSKDELLS